VVGDGPALDVDVDLESICIVGDVDAVGLDGGLDGDVVDETVALGMLSSTLLF